ncbi:MAG: NUDIX hydrolase [Sphingomonadales bacterium]
MASVTPTDPVKAVQAASLIIIRDGVVRDDGRSIEVLMVERHGAIEFAGGAYVFPGGKVQMTDATRRLTGRFPGLQDLPLRMAAIRETFEETGVLFARRQGSRRIAARAEQRLLIRRVASRRHLRDRALLVEFQRHGLTLAADLLIPFSHWITPVIRRSRFDTMFYLAVMPAGQMVQHDGNEAVGAFWVAPEDMVGRHGYDIKTLMFPQRLNLLELSRARTVTEALEIGVRRPVVPILPELEKTDEGIFAHIPEEAGYGGSRFLFAKPPENTGGTAQKA